MRGKALRHTPQCRRANQESTSRPPGRFSSGLDPPECKSMREGGAADGIEHDEPRQLVRVVRSGQVRALGRECRAVSAALDDVARAARVIDARAAVRIRKESDGAARPCFDDALVLCNLT